METINTIEDAKNAAAQLEYSWQRFCGYVMDEIRHRLSTDVIHDSETGRLEGFVTHFEGDQVEDIAAEDGDCWDADEDHEIVEAFLREGSTAMLEQVREFVRVDLENR